MFPQSGVEKQIREFDPDVLHIATEGPLGMAARRFALRNDLPFTTAYHTRFPEYVHARLRLPLSWSYAWLRRFHGPSKGVMAPTQVVVDDLQANGFKNVRLWSRGVDSNIFRPQESRRLDSTRPIFLYVGRVAVEKNVEAFLELDLPGLKWVVGTGPALERIQARHPHVNYLGLLDREELAKVYAAADVFVHPTWYDPCSLVTLEASASGLPVVTTRFNGASEMMRDGAEGFILNDPADITQLAGRMRELLDPALRERQGAAGRALAVEHTFERQTKQFLDLYAEIAGAKS